MAAMAVTVQLHPTVSKLCMASLGAMREIITHENLTTIKTDFNAVMLQALLEVIINETALVLDLLSAQNHQMRTAIYQNRLALDYLIAEEGGVCRKFSLSKCCIKTDDHGEIIKNVTTRIGKLVHVPVQQLLRTNSN